MTDHIAELTTGAPRLRDAVRTRRRILAAAQQVFSSRDYTQARLSDIATIAGVNQALLVRYFGSKDQLFATALEQVLLANQIDQNMPRPAFGRTVVERLAGVKGVALDPLPMVIHAVSDQVAQPIALALMRKHIVAPLGRWIGGPDGEARAAEVLVLCAGLFTYSKLLPLEPFAGAMTPGTRLWLERSLQAIVDGAGSDPAGDV